MSHKDFSQQFPSPPKSDNESVYHTPPEYLFPVFPNENEPQNTPPDDMFPVFPNEIQPQNAPPVNNPPVENQPHPSGLTDEQLRRMEQDEEIFREFQEIEAEEQAAFRARDLESEYSSEEDGWVSDDSFF